MSTPKRFTKGVTNVPSDKTMGSFLSMDPTLVFGYFNDFFQYAATDWVLTTAEAGGGSASEAISNTDSGGYLSVVNAAGNADHDNFQLSKDGGTNDSETLKFAVGKKAWFKTRIRSDDGDKVHIFIGLHITNTDPQDTAPTDGVYFEITGGDISFVVRKNGVSSTESALATYGDETEIVLGYFWDGIDTFHIFVNDVEVATVGSGTLPDDEYLAVSFGVENEEAVSHTLHLDYIGAWMER